MNLRPTGTTLGILVCLAGSAFVAWQLGGALGLGVIAGFLAGASIAALGIAWQHHVLRLRPRDVMRAVAGSFLAKLAVLLCGALAFRFLPIGEQIDWRSFVVAFAACALVVMIAGNLYTPRRPEGSRA